MPDEVILEFPILVYKDEDQWVAQSILTCTTAVAADHFEALREVCRLVVIELTEAIKDSEGDVEKAMDLITCPAPEDIVRLYYTRAKLLALPNAEELGEPLRRHRKGTPRYIFSPREAIAAV